MSSNKTDSSQCSDKDTSGNILGKGRSAAVYKIDSEGKSVARKIFIGSGAADLAMSICFGAPVDYQWSEDAVRTAFYRRKVLSSLLSHWFGGKMTMALPLTVGKDDASGYYYLDAEFIDGSPPRLYNPFASSHISEYSELKEQVMPELQNRLKEAGFFGAMWQAGYGQPCAIANFLLCKSDEQSTKTQWAWIDVESGVPALASHSIIKQLGFYLPWAIKLRRPLFDDIDGEKLRAYVLGHSDSLKAGLGQDTFGELQHDVEQLIAFETKWKSLTRCDRIISYYEAKGAISLEYSADLQNGLKSKTCFLLNFYFPTQIKSILNYCGRKTWSLIRLISPIRWGVFFIRSVISRKYRIGKSCAYIEKRITQWEALNRINGEQAALLKRELHHQESSQYLADFGIFLALKPFGYFIKLLIVPLLLVLGWISPVIAIAIIAFFSISVRFIYALLRGIEDAILGRPFPYVALLVAPIPSVGTVAHPCQMVHSARKGHEVSQFIVYEVMSSIAQKMPIWGGCNSELEYFLNHLAYKMIKVSE